MKMLVLVMALIIASGQWVEVRHLDESTSAVQDSTGAWRVVNWQRSTSRGDYAVGDTVRFVVNVRPDSTGAFEFERWGCWLIESEACSLGTRETAELLHTWEAYGTGVRGWWFVAPRWIPAPARFIVSDVAEFEWPPQECK